MSQTTTNNPFETCMVEHCKYRISQRDTLSAVRKKAWERLGEIGLPTKQSEKLKLVGLSNVLPNHYYLPETNTPETATYSPSTLLSLETPPEKATIVFVNGYYQPSLSDIRALSSSVIILPLEQAIVSYSIFLNYQWITAIKQEKDPFVMINTILHNHGLFLYIPPRTVLSAPIEVVHIIKASERPLVIAPRVHLCVGAHAEARIFSKISAPADANYCFNQVYEISMEENAHIDYTQVSLEGSSNACHFDAVRVLQKNSSRFTSINVTNGSRMMRNDYHISLLGENAETSLNALWKLQDKREVHNNVLINHTAPHCRSQQLFKGVLDHFSRSSFEGTILVQQEAQKTDAFQLNRNLLLSDRAHADSKPNLKVLADDVKASHGATVSGKLDEEEIFFLKTRGLSQKQAEQFLIDAFCKEITDLVVYPPKTI